VRLFDRNVTLNLLPGPRVLLPGLLAVGAVLVHADETVGGTPETTPTLSTAQRNFESVALATNGGLHSLLWSLPASGKPSTTATPAQFIVDITSGGLKESPLTHGTQNDTATWKSLATPLKVPPLPINLAPLVADESSPPSIGPKVRLPFMAVEPGTGTAQVVSSDPTTGEQVSYVGSNIKIDTLAKGSDTIAYSTLITAVTTVSVAGEVIDSASNPLAKAVLEQFHLTGNAALLRSGATFAAN